MPKKPNFARIVKALRKSYGQSQNQFAADCNLAQSQISEIESGKYDPGVVTLMAIAEGTDCVVVLNAKNGKVFVPRVKSFSW